MSKFTKASFKSVLRKNQGNVYIKVTSTFDGMSDCIRSTGNSTFAPVQKAENVYDNNLGMKGVWLVGGGRDIFDQYTEGDFNCIRVSNCCGTFVIGLKK